MHDKHPKDFHNSDMTEYTRQLKQSAEATIMTASTIIDSQSTIPNGNTRQHSSSSRSGEFSNELRKHKIEEWISQLAINHEERGPDFDGISELMPDDSISCIGLGTNKQSQKINGAGMPWHLPRTSKSAENLTNTTTHRKKPVRGISEERLAHMNLDERSSVGTEEKFESNDTSEKTPTKYQAGLNVNTSYDEKSAKKLQSALMQTREANEWIFDDELLRLAKTKAGQGRRSSANIVGTMLYLLENGADINVKDAHGDTALHHVSKEGNIAVLELLCGQGADINMNNKNGQSALHLAAELGNTPVVEILLRYDADIEQKNEHSRHTALSIAASRGWTSTVGCLLKARAPVNSRDRFGMTPLHAATIRGHLEIAEMLLTAKASVDAKGDGSFTSLHLAVHEGHIEIVETLLKNGASVIAKDNVDTTPLHYAVSRGYLEIVEILLKAGAPVDIQDNKGRTPLYDAAKEGHVEIAETLLKAGVSVGAKDNDGNTPLHRAADGGHLEMVESLLKAGALLDSREKDGGTSLHGAAAFGYVEIVETLLKAGALLDPKDNYGRTPLTYAAQQGHRTTIELLLAAGAHITARSKKGDTVLHLVLYRKHYDDCDERCAFCAGSETRLDIAELLCEHGADPSAKNNDGIIVLSGIRGTNDYPKSEQRALIKMLKKFGAK